MAKTHASGVYGGRLVFSPGAFGESIGNRNLAGLQGERGWDYHIYEV